MRNNDIVTARYALLGGLLLMFLASFATCASPREALSQDVAATIAVVPEVFVPVAPAPCCTEGRPAPAVPLLRALRREDVLYAAQACVHESSWRGGLGGTFDCGAQISVFLERRRTGEHFREVIARTMPRFARGSTSRAWVLSLPAGPLREDPPGWPAGYPARHDSDAWHGVFARVEGFLRGREPLPCTDVEQWFGRRTDSERLSAMLATGRWIEADCNPSGALATQTLNAYLERTVPDGI